MAFAAPFVPESCTPLNNPESVRGKIFFMFGAPATGSAGCSSKQKVLVARDLGATAVVIINIIPGNFGTPLFAFPDPFSEKKIPAYLMDQVQKFRY